MAMIPFYAERINHLDERIKEEREKRDLANQEELQFLQRTKADLINSFDKEKNEVEQKAQALYNTWLEIDNLRKKQQYAQASAYLKVYKRDIGSGQFEYSFAYLN